jgi:hypothetical protein
VLIQLLLNDFIESKSFTNLRLGIDHMTALRLIKGLQGRGGKITRFTSLCGGLPAPEAADNPIGYKFSWSPIGVLRAATNVSCLGTMLVTLEICCRLTLFSCGALSDERQRRRYPRRAFAEARCTG